MMHMHDLTHLRISGPRHLVERRRKARRVGAAHRLKGRIEAGEALERGARPRMLVAVERQLAVVMVDRYQGVVESPLLDGAGSACLALHRVPIHVLAAESFDGGDEVRGDALGHLRMQVEEVPVIGMESLGVGRRVTGHELHPAPDHGLLMTRHNTHGRKGHCLLPAAAEAMQRDACGGQGPARVEDRHPGDIVGMIAAAGTATGHHVLDVGRVETHLLLQAIQYLRHAALWMNFAQGTYPGFAAAARRAHRVDDPGFSHGLPLSLSVCADSTGYPGAWGCRSRGWGRRSRAAPLRDSR
jgi:hypothetical protein